jgi:hypothetical protein
MFFRREKPRHISFEERLDQLKAARFTVTRENGRARVSKLGAAAIIEDSGDGVPKIGKAGIVVGNEIGYLVHGGYQAFFETGTRRKVPALAEHLKALHTFEEDLKEGLGIVSLYNTSLGTTFDRHRYDRVEDRDLDRPDLPWEASVRDNR